MPGRRRGRATALITFVLRRLLLMCPRCWVIATLTFFLMRLAPGGPFQSERDIPAAAKARCSRKYGLDRPLGEQYVTFLAQRRAPRLRALVQVPGAPVRDIIRRGASRSRLELGGWALLLALRARHPDRRDRGGAPEHRRPTTASMARGAGRGVDPELRARAAAGARLLAHALLAAAGAVAGARRAACCRCVTLAAAYVAYVARLTRGGMLEVLRQDFIRTARAKGLPERRGGLRARAAARHPAGGVATSARPPRAS